MADAQILKSDTDWAKELTPEEFEIMRKKGTEAPFTGKYWDSHEAGMYRCRGCGNELFSSETKFDSRTGWPSFYDVVKSENVETREDTDQGMNRTEVICRRCGAHLGHVFPDGPANKTGLRYCINSACLRLDKDSK